MDYRQRKRIQFPQLLCSHEPPKPALGRYDLIKPLPVDDDDLDVAVEPEPICGGAANRAGQMAGGDRAGAQAVHNLGAGRTNGAPPLTVARLTNELWVERGFGRGEFQLQLPVIRPSPKPDATVIC
jgi:hypothetical protein